jgi:hypothetical protein
MSPGHVKAFAKALLNQIGRFEAKVGEIAVQKAKELTDGSDEADTDGRQETDKAH